MSRLNFLMESCYKFIVFIVNNPESNWLFAFNRPLLFRLIDLKDYFSRTKYIL